MLPVNIPRCHQIHLNGVRCGSPALRGQSHCYYHSVVRQKRDVPTIPYLEDALSVQFSLREIMQGVALGKWDTKRAALLLYALQIASSNLKRVDSELRLAKYDAITDVPAASYINAPEITSSKNNVGAPPKSDGAPFVARHVERQVGKKKRAAHRSATPAKKSAARADEPMSRSADEPIAKPPASASFPGMFIPGAEATRLNGSNGSAT